MVVLTATEWKAAMRIQQSSHQGCVVQTLVGRLDLATATGQRAILSQLAEHSPTIICDLGQKEAKRLAGGGGVDLRSHHHDQLLSRAGS